MQPSHARLAGNGLGSNLNELVITSEYPGPSRERVLRRRGHSRATSFRRNRSWARLTCGYQADAQCGKKLHSTERSDCAFDKSERLYGAAGAWLGPGQGEADSNVCSLPENGYG